MLDEAVLCGAKICVVGNLNRDIKTSPITPGEQLFRDGETSIDGIIETVGGGGANSAAIAAGLGAESTFIGQVGDDELGRRLEQSLTRAGVRCHLHRAANLETGTTVNLVYNTGQRHFLSCHPNNTSLAFETLDLGPLAGASHLLRADVWFSEAMLHGGNVTLFSAARDLGVPISIDLNWDPMWGHAPAAEVERRKAAVRDLLPSVELVHGNVRELNGFAGTREIHHSVGRLLEWGARAIVVHMADRGAGWFGRDEFVVEPAAPVERRSVATGTGDVLSVCMMLLHGQRDVAQTQKLRLANRIVAEFMEGRRTLIPAL